MWLGRRIHKAVGSIPKAGKRKELVYYSDSDLHLLLMKISACSGNAYQVCVVDDDKGWGALLHPGWSRKAFFRRCP